MARGRKRAIRVEAHIIIDATPERLAMAANDHDYVNAAEIDPREQTINRVRRFRDTMLDRLYRNDKLTWVQWYAGDQYRDTHARAQIEAKLSSSYGERTSAGEIGYGLPRTIGQLNARQRLREYRSAMPMHMQGFMDRFLIRDALPRYGGRAHFRQMSEIRKALDVLAMHMRMTT